MKGNSYMCFFPFSSDKFFGLGALFIYFFFLQTASERESKSDSPGTLSKKKIWNYSIFQYWKARKLGSNTWFK